MTVFCLVPFETQGNGYKEATQLQTKLCKAVAVVLGTTSEVKSLDQARRCHKSKPNNRDAANDYLNKLALVQIITSLTWAQQIKEKFWWVGKRIFCDSQLLACISWRSQKWSYSNGADEANKVCKCSVKRMENGCVRLTEIKTYILCYTSYY